MAQAGPKRKCTEDLNSEIGPKARRQSEHPGCPVRARQHHCLTHLQHNRPSPRVRPLPVNPADANNRRRLLALDLFPTSTDIDIHRHRDISIAEERQKQRLKRHYGYLCCCKVCIREGHPVTYLNLPCGHLTNCEECNPLMDKCACCGKDVQDTKYCPVVNYNGKFHFVEWFESRDRD